MAELSERASHHATDESAAPAEPAPAQPESMPPRRRSATRETVETLVIALLLFFGMRQIIPSVLVDGRSMVPSLEDRQHLLVNRILYWHLNIGGTQRYLFHPPQRGDVVVIDPPVQTSEPYIKRLIGLPGDTIRIGECATVQGSLPACKVFVNGIALNEDYIAQPPAYTFPPDGRPLQLGPDQYFVLGDNRNASSDGHIFGPITSDRIIGKAWLSFWPLRDLGFLPHRTYPV